MKKILKKVILFLVLANVGFGDIAQNLGDYYSINKGKVYYRDEKIENADIMSFKVLNEDYAKDKNHIYGKIKDPETFEFLPNGIIYGTLYGKDKYNVYYIKNKMLNCFDSSYFIYEVKRINKDKVEVLNNWFIKDDKNIYFEGEILEGVDYNTFEVLPNGDGKDKNRSYEYLPKDEWRWF